MYPACQFEIIKIVDMVMKDKLFVLVNLFFVLLESGAAILSRKRKPGDAFFRTTYIFRTVKRRVNEIISGGRYLFTFQIGSAFDTSTPGVPHFLYTDHTHLENLKYPGYTRKHLYCEKWLKLEKTVYHNATVNFVRSSNILRSVVHDYGCPAARVVCVYAGSNAPESFAKSVEEKSYSEKNILFVGSDWKRKGGDELIEAFKKILEVDPEVTLTLVGGGVPKDIDLRNCEIVDKVGLNELDRYFRRATVFCLPTRREPFGIVFLEAMHYKLPIVSSPNGAIPDFLKNGVNGYLVPNGAVDALTAALLVLLNDPLRCRKFGEAGYSIAMKNYTWEKTGLRMKAVIDSVLGCTADRAARLPEEKIKYETRDTEKC